MTQSGLGLSGSLWLPCREHTEAGQSRRREPSEGPLPVSSWEMVVAQTRGSRTGGEKGAGSGAVFESQATGFSDGLGVGWEGKSRVLKTRRVWGGVELPHLPLTSVRKTAGGWVLEADQDLALDLGSGECL